MLKTKLLFATAALLLMGSLFVGLPKSRPTPSNGSRSRPQSQVAMGSEVRLRATVDRSELAADGRANLDLRLFGEEPGHGGSAPPTGVLVIDRSASVGSKALERTRSATKQLLGRLSPDAQVALVSYARRATVDVPLGPLQRRRGKLSEELDRLVDGGATDLARGLQTGLGLLEAVPSANPTVVLVSDGTPGPDPSRGRRALHLAERARRRGIRIHTVSTRSRADGPHPCQDELAFRLARATGGLHRHAARTGALADALHDAFAGPRNLAGTDVVIGTQWGSGVQVVDSSCPLGPSGVIWFGTVPVGHAASCRVRLRMPAVGSGPSQLARLRLSYRTDTGRVEYEDQLTVLRTRSPSNGSSRSRSVPSAGRSER
ncbi:MAG TPA: vWA domain-containing protein [Myxococcales bacterium LLY-WYZ-16_1]|nr:vWA domain-containing protein [Myxococcales bacterium LLY-WYZ-16_1]